MVNTNDLIPLNKAAEICGLSHEHLALMIRKGEIWGDKFGGRNWFTTKSAIDRYMRTNRKPGPKTKNT